MNKTNVVLARVAVCGAIAVMALVLRMPDTGAMRDEIKAMSARVADLEDGQRQLRGVVTTQNETIHCMYETLDRFLRSQTTNVSESVPQHNTLEYRGDWKILNTPCQIH